MLHAVGLLLLRDDFHKLLPECAEAASAAMLRCVLTTRPPRLEVTTFVYKNDQFTFPWSGAAALLVAGVSCAGVDPLGWAGEEAERHLAIWPVLFTSTTGQTPL